MSFNLSAVFYVTVTSSGGLGNGMSVLPMTTAPSGVHIRRPM